MNRLFIMSLLVFALAACGQLRGDVLTIRTADPRLNLAFRLLPPAPVPPASTPAIVPPTATAEPILPTVTPTPECVNAKANISASNERIYHLPGDANYNTVKIDKDGEAIYCTAAEAEANGFRRAQR